jgi:hypothetical protein
MNETFLFIFGLIATICAVGPLAVAAYLDTQSNKKD